VLCNREGIECVAEQLLASEVGIFSVTLVVICCSYFDSYNVGNLQSSYSAVSFVESVYCLL
jgi:hypothetical protein